MVVAIELMCCVMYAADLGITFWLHGRNNWTVIWHTSRALALVLMLVDTIVYAGSGFTTLRLSRMLRPIMLISRMRHVRKMAGGLVSTLKDVAVSV